MKHVFNYNPTKSSTAFSRRREYVILTIMIAIFIGIFFVMIFGILSVPIWIVVGIYIKNKYLLYREYATKHTVLATEPPHELRPAEIRFLYDHSHNLDMITSITIDLIVHGYIDMTIITSKEGMRAGHYILTRTQKMADQLRPYEEEMLSFLFTYGTSVRWHDVYREQDIAGFLSTVSFMIQQELQRRGYYYFYDNFADLTYKEALHNAMRTKGRSIWESVWNFGRGMAGYATVKRDEILPQIIGYRNYLAKTAAERADFHTDPDKMIVYFETSTPYVIAFGLTTMWQDELWGTVYESAWNNGDPSLTTTNHNIK